MRKVIGLTLALAAGFASAVAADPTPKEQQPGETNQLQKTLDDMKDALGEWTSKNEPLYYECFAPDGTRTLRIYQGFVTAIAQAGEQPRAAVMGRTGTYRLFSYWDEEASKVMGNDVFILAPDNKAGHGTINEEGGVDILIEGWQCEEKPFPDQAP